MTLVTRRRLMQGSLATGLGLALARLTGGETAAGARMLTPEGAHYGMVERTTTPIIAQARELEVGTTPPTRETISAVPWHRDIQVYGMLPLLPEDARALGLTVNGLWGGYFWDTPIRQGDFLYRSDDEHVAAMHEADLKVAGVIDASGVYAPMLAKYPELHAAIEARADGQPAVYETEATYAYMCLHHPQWLSWQIDEGKRIIDAGADMITLDNLVPLGRGLLLGSLALPGGTPAFADATINAFRAWAGGEVGALATADVRQRLAESEMYLYGEPIAKHDLLDRFVAFLDAASYEHIRQLVTALRAHAESRGRAIAICGNWSLAGLRFGAQGEYLLDSSRYWRLLDLFASEFRYSIHGEDASVTPMPRQKMVGLYRLARGMKATPSVFLPMTGTAFMSDHLRRLPNFSFLQMAEAYANRQQMAVMAYPGDASVLEFSRHLTPLSTFIRAHPDLYAPDLQALADLALLILRPESYDAYSGLAQALAESNVQFETVTTFGDQPLTATALLAHRVVVVATLDGASPGDVAMLNEYVARGGRLVVFGTERPPALVVSPMVVLVNQDLGTDYLNNYRDATRLAIRQKALGSATPLLRLSRDDRTVLATAFRRAGTLVIHLLNYAHDFARDTVADRTNLTLTLQLPPGTSYQQVALSSPDANPPRPTVSRRTQTSMTIAIPRLRRYAVLVLS